MTERLADDSQVEDAGGDGYGLSPRIWCQPRPRASRTRRSLRYLNEYIRCVRSNVFSSDDKTMAATTKHRFSCLVCPIQITGLRNLKRHYFERYKLVPTKKRSQLTDDIFGLKPAQLRKLRPDSVDDVALCSTRQLIYMRKRPTAERGASTRSDNTAPMVRSAIVSAATAGKPLSKKATKKSRSKTESCCTATAFVELTTPTTPTAASRSDSAPLLVRFERATVVDLVGRISRVVANCAGPDRLADLDAVLRSLLYQADSNLRRALTLAILAGVQ